MSSAVPSVSKAVDAIKKARRDHHGSFTQSAPPDVVLLPNAMASYRCDGYLLIYTPENGVVAVITDSGEFSDDAIVALSAQRTALVKSQVGPLMVHLGARVSRLLPKSNPFASPTRRIAGSSAV